jgi:hypothetical protein
MRPSSQAVLLEQRDSQFLKPLSSRYLPRNILSSALISILLTKMSNPTANVTPTTGPAPSLVVNDPRAEMLRGVGSWAETPANAPFPSHAGNLPQCQSHCSLLLIFVARVLTASSR